MKLSQRILHAKASTRLCSTENSRLILIVKRLKDRKRQPRRSIGKTVWADFNDKEPQGPERPGRSENHHHHEQDPLPRTELAKKHTSQSNSGENKEHQSNTDRKPPSRNSGAGSHRVATAASAVSLNLLQQISLTTPSPADPPP